MKTMIFSLAMAAAMITPLCACSDDDTTLEQKDWSGTEEFLPTDERTTTTFYKPYNGYVGDPMPFFDPVAQDFKVMYLQDYRPNPAGTYHPIWCVSTKDAANYTSLGEVISCGGLSEQDAAIGTGSTIYNESDGMYYTFYTGNKYMPTAADNGQVVMYATSKDFKTWTKNRTFYLKGDDYGYSKNDFRDPFVFKGDEGLYHMIVSTVKGSKGTIAEFTSPDLKDWTHAGDFMNMMWDRFYECPDVFKMGDWWYLVYSEIHSAIRKVQYFKGRTLDELKACTRNDAGIWPDSHEGFLDSRGLYAGKTASDGTNRYIWGWCATRGNNTNTNALEWAGTLVAHKLIQHEDGTLTLGEVPAISEKYNVPAEVKLMASNGLTEDNGYQLSGDDAYALFSRLGTHNKISFTVETSNNWDKFGISLVRGGNSKAYYTMVISPEGENTRKVNLEQEGEEGIGFMEGMDSYVFARPADNIYNVTIYTDNSVCVMYINDVLCYTNRIYGIQKNCWSINNYGGNIKVNNLKISQY